MCLVASAWRQRRGKVLPMPRLARLAAMAAASSALALEGGGGGGRRNLATSMRWLGFARSAAVGAGGKDGARPGARSLAVWGPDAGRSAAERDSKRRLHEIEPRVRLAPRGALDQELSAAPSKHARALLGAAGALGGRLKGASERALAAFGIGRPRGAPWAGNAAQARLRVLPPTLDALHHENSNRRVFNTGRRAGGQPAPRPSAATPATGNLALLRELDVGAAAREATSNRILKFFGLSRPRTANTNPEGVTLGTSANAASSIATRRGLDEEGLPGGGMQHDGSDRRGFGAGKREVVNPARVAGAGTADQAKEDLHRRRGYDDDDSSSSARQRDATSARILSAFEPGRARTSPVAGASAETPPVSAADGRRARLRADEFGLPGSLALSRDDSDRLVFDGAGRRDGVHPAPKRAVAAPAASAGAVGSCHDARSGPARPSLSNASDCGAQKKSPDRSSRWFGGLFGRSRPRATAAPEPAVAPARKSDARALFEPAKDGDGTKGLSESASARLLRIFGLSKPRATGGPGPAVGISHQAAASRPRSRAAPNLLVPPPDTVFGRPSQARWPSFRQVDRSAQARARALLPLVSPASNANGSATAAVPASDVDRVAAAGSSTGAAAIGGSSSATHRVLLSDSEDAIEAPPRRALGHDTSYRAVDVSAKQAPRARAGEEGPDDVQVSALTAAAAPASAAITFLQDAAAAVLSSAARFLGRQPSFGHLDFVAGRARPPGADTGGAAATASAAEEKPQTLLAFANPHARAALLRTGDHLPPAALAASRGVASDDASASKPKKAKKRKGKHRQKDGGAGGRRADSPMPASTSATLPATSPPPSTSSAALAAAVVQSALDSSATTLQPAPPNLAESQAAMRPSASAFVIAVGNSPLSTPQYGSARFLSVFDTKTLTATPSTRAAATAISPFIGGGARAETSPLQPWRLSASRRRVASMRALETAAAGPHGDDAKGSSVSNSTPIHSSTV